MAKQNGYVYAIRIFVGYKSVVKVGTTNRSVIKRVLEIAEELYRSIGYLPKICVLRQQSTKFNYEVEAAILKETKDKQCRIEGDIEFSGQSEIRDIPDAEICAIYDRCISQGYKAVKPYIIEM